MSRYEEALRLIDAANSADPNQDDTPSGPAPKELLYGQRMSSALALLEPNASEELRVAVRAQHLERWVLPRSDYPEGKAGYHKWRTEQAARHARRASELLQQAGYDESFAARVTKLIRKQGIKSDPEVQTLEDVACLIFLEHYLSDFATEHPEEKIIDILRKTWKKMSERGQQAALRLPLGLAEKALVAKALG